MSDEQKLLKNELLKDAKKENLKWANNEIKYFSPSSSRYLKYGDFIVCEEKADQKIDVFSVIGTDNFNFLANKTWVTALDSRHEGKMLGCLREYKEKPEYYSKKIHQENFYYNTCDGNQFYISGGGNHRNTMAKFIFSKTGQRYISGVTIYYHKIDLDLYKAYRRLKFYFRNKNITIFTKKYKNKISVNLTLNSKDYQFNCTQEIYSFLASQKSLIKRVLSLIC